MSCSYVTTACLFQGEVVQIQIEADIQPGLPYFSIIGLPDKQIEEAKERVRAAIKNSGFTFPLGRITVNLSPSYVAKSGTGFDLGIALGILQASHSIPEISPKVWVIGELSLEGVIRSYPMLVLVLLEVVRKRAQGCIVPMDNKPACALVYECPVLKVGHLQQIASLICNGLCVFKRSRPLSVSSKTPDSYLFDEVVGQSVAKRALEISLAGGHHLLMVGPPGIGKTMLARSAHELLPVLSREEKLEVAQIYSHKQEAYDLQDYTPPFRAPHHSISVSNLIGGGSGITPGEVSLAHHGVLFLDEFPEFIRIAREALRQPMQDGYISLNRRGRTIRLPAQCIIIAAQNPCPCGRASDCKCTAGDLARYTRALSQPIIDRFSLFVNVDVQDSSQMRLHGAYDTAEAVRARILHCREYVRSKGYSCGISRLNKLELQKVAPISEQLITSLQESADKLKMSARSFIHVWRVATTITILKGAKEVNSEDINEAFQYRYKEPC